MVRARVPLPHAACLRGLSTWCSLTHATAQAQWQGLPRGDRMIAGWWQTAQGACGRLPGLSGTSEPPHSAHSNGYRAGPGYEKGLGTWAFVVEPPIGIEPMTYALRVPASAVHDGSPQFRGHGRAFWNGSGRL
jgi:hypothetical protein